MSRSKSVWIQIGATVLTKSSGVPAPSLPSTSTATASSRRPRSSGQRPRTADVVATHANRNGLRRRRPDLRRYRTRDDMDLARWDQMAGRCQLQSRLLRALRYRGWACHGRRRRSTGTSRRHLGVPRRGVGRAARHVTGRPSRRDERKGGGEMKRLWIVLRTAIPPAHNGTYARLI
jgi:hypothetical protein